MTRFSTYALSRDCETRRLTNDLASQPCCSLIVIGIGHNAFDQLKLK